MEEKIKVKDFTTRELLNNTLMEWIGPTVWETRKFKLLERDKKPALCWYAISFRLQERNLLNLI